LVVRSSEADLLPKLVGSQLNETVMFKGQYLKKDGFETPP
jgi:hypothetical protein